MTAFVLLGFKSSPMGHAGEWVRLAVVNGNDLNEAAAKLDAKVTCRNGSIMDGRRFCGIITRTIVAAKRLRGRKRRTAISETRWKIQNLEHFRLEPIPTLG